MDLIRAQQLLIKIQAFLDNGNEGSFSRLEKDLVKSYVVQLYDALMDEAAVKQSETSRVSQKAVHEPVQQDVPPAYSAKTMTPEAIKKVVFEPEVKEVPKIVPDIKVAEIDPDVTVTRPETKPVHVPVPDPVLKVVHQPALTNLSAELSEGLTRLFELPMADDFSGRFNHVPIANIESALGLNERIFTLNELFGGNKALFDTTCAVLNGLESYADATRLLMKGPARDFNWTDPAKLKMAEHFIRVVARRYPRS